MKIKSATFYGSLSYGLLNQIHYIHLCPSPDIIIRTHHIGSRNILFIPVSSQRVLAGARLTLALTSRIRSIISIIRGTLLYIRMIVPISPMIFFIIMIPFPMIMAKAAIVMTNIPRVMAIPAFFIAPVPIVMANRAIVMGNIPLVKAGLDTVMENSPLVMANAAIVMAIIFIAVESSKLRNEKS